MTLSRIFRFFLAQMTYRKITKATIFIILVLLPAACDSKKEFFISGTTMGTQYHIKIVSCFFVNQTALKQNIDKRLDEINQSMSTYIKNSEISKFNALHNTEKFYISEDFFNVMRTAKHLHKLTDGAWDGAIMPLVNLWGFGFNKRKNIPSQEQIDKLLPEIGFNNIEISEKRYLRKKQPFILLDLASIAKGYAVDQLAILIRKNKINNFTVEIGGEVYVSGIRKDGNFWQIGINAPTKDASYDQVRKTLKLHNKALATSGDYKKFFKANDRYYSHILNPITGYPVDNNMASVSIIADTCAFADGLATAIMVLGKKKGIALVNKLDNVECLIIVRQKENMFADFYSKGFETINDR